MKIGQIKFIGEEKDELIFSNLWSENLFKDKIILNLSIYAMPGTRFKITRNNDSGELIINETGIFSMNFENRPLTELYVSEQSYNNLNGKHFIVIDIVYEEREIHYE